MPAPNWHPLVDIPGPKFYSTDGKNKLIHTILYGTFKTKSTLHAAAFRTPWCKICAIFPAVQIEKLKKKKKKLSWKHFNTESFREVRAESMISGCQPSTSATTQHISDFKTTYNLFLISHLHRFSFWGERYGRSRLYQSTGYLQQLTAPEHWRVPDLCKSLILPTPWCQEECQRPPVSLGGLALQGDTPASVCRLKTSFAQTLPPAGTSNSWLFHVTSQTLLKKLPGQKPGEQSWEQTEDHSNSALETGATGLLWSLRVLLRHSWSMRVEK